MWYAIILMLSVWVNCWTMEPYPIDLSQKNLLVKNEVGELYCDKDNLGHFDLLIEKNHKIEHVSCKNSFADIDVKTFSKFTLRKIGENIEICALARTKEGSWNAFNWSFYGQNKSRRADMRLAKDLPNNATLVVPISKTLYAVYAESQGTDRLAGFIDIRNFIVEAKYQAIPKNVNTTYLEKFLVGDISKYS